MTKKIKIPLLIPEMPTTEELIPLLKQIDSNKVYTNFGPLNAVFEQSLLNTFENNSNLHITTISNCTIGIELALNCLNLKKGASILVPSLTFAASATAIQSCGFLPIFSDIHPNMWILTPEIALENLRSKDFDAVLPVSTFGIEQDTTGWDNFTKETGIPVLIDAASAFGNQKIGESTSAVFSLHATKSLGSGEGGFIASKNSDFIAQIKTLSNFGIVGNDYKGYINRAGTNAKLSEYHAAVGLASLNRFADVRDKNIVNFNIYLRRLQEEKIAFTNQNGGENRNHTLLPLRFKLQNSTGMDDFQAKMGDAGIQTRRWYYPLLNEYACFNEIAEKQEVPVARKISEELVGLPFYPSMTANHIDYVISNLKSCL